jgi:hypothetical protein
MGSTGPCPVCGTWLATAAGTPPSPQDQFPIESTEPCQPPQKRKRGTILADANIDYEHSAQLQALHALKIIGLAILVLSFCLAIAWFMKEWGSH